MAISVVDIGTSSIKTLITNIEDSKEPNVVGFSNVPNTGMRKGGIVDIDATISAIKQSVTEAELMSGIKANHLYASIGGENVTGITGKGIVTISSSNGITWEDVIRVIDQTKITSNMDSDVLHILPTGYTVDEKTETKHPVGLTGNKLSAETMLIAVPHISIQNFSNAIERSGYECEDFIVQHVAAYNSVLDSEEKELGVCLVDIGGGTIKISIFHNDSLRYIDTISIGGENITQDLSIGLRTPRAEAEKIKIEHGSCSKELIDYTKSITIPGVNARDNREISIEKVVDIIEPRVAEMMELIRESIMRSTYMSKLNTGIVFTGGTANLRGLQKIAEQQLELPVKVGHPKRMQGLSDHINNPVYGVAVGMVMYIYQERNRPHHIDSKRAMGVQKTFRKFTDNLKEMFKL